MFDGYFMTRNSKFLVSFQVLSMEICSKEKAVGRQENLSQEKAAGIQENL